MKVSINTLCGGYMLSPKAMKWLFDNARELFEEIAEDSSEWLDMDTEITYPEMFVQIDDCYFNIFNTSQLRHHGKWYETELQYSFSSLRYHPKVIECIELFGDEASYEKGSIKIVEIPDDVEWYIEESETGRELIHEMHRCWSEKGLISPPGQFVRL